MNDFTLQRSRMVRRQIERRGITDQRVLDAFAQIPREHFVPDDLRLHAYEDRPLPIGDRQTISQPLVVAQMIEAAGIEHGSRVLEIGAGSGYAAAILAQLAGSVYAIERVTSLAEAARARLERLGISNCEIVIADGQLGLPERAPFDAILVSARSLRVPEALPKQLQVGGRLVIPVGSEGFQTLLRISRTAADRWQTEELGAVRFVPLLPGTQ